MSSRLTEREIFALGVPLVRRVELLDEVTSTQVVARELAAAGAPDGTLVLACRQAGGKGRLGRDWGSPEGGLWMSLLLRPEFAPQLAPRITQSAAVAVAKTLIEFGILAKVKWPNDILVDGRKICGVLAESKMTFGEGGVRLDHAVLGIGLNVNLDPEDLGLSEYQAASVRGELGRGVPLLELLSKLLPKLATELNDVEDFRGTLRDLKNLSDTLGRCVRVRRLGEVVEGVAVEIDPEGTLILSTENGLVQLFEGDVEYLRGL
ncbi:MAG: biotin--[acetyl-CoA-carboxylase] ligase [Rubrobacter sp.]